MYHVHSASKPDSTGHRRIPQYSELIDLSKQVMLAFYMRHIYLLDKYAFTSELCTHTRKPKHTLKLYAILVVCVCVCVCV